MSSSTPSVFALRKVANNALDIYNQYAPASVDPLTGVLPQFDASKGGTPLAVPAKQTSSWWPSPEAWANQSAPSDKQLGDYAGLSMFTDPNGLSWKDFMHYGYNNPVWRGARAAGRFVNAATDPKNQGSEWSAGVDAAAGRPPAASISAPAPGQQNTKFEPGAMHYGLGGAGVGALLGASMGRKGTRGRNALIGAGLGGGAGLLAQYLMNKKTAAEEKQAVGMMDGMKNFAVDMAQAQGASRGQMLGLAGGGGLGGLAGALYGAYNPGAKAVLDENGNPTLKRRSRLMGALRGGLGGAALGAGVGNFAGHNLGGMYGRHVALQELRNKSAFDFGQMLNQAGTFAKDMYNKVPESVRSGAGMGGLGGAALGGLAGLVAPGEDVEYDNMGREVRRNPRSRFGAMMRGALGGGLAGAAGGAAAGHFAPQQTQQAANYLRQQGHNLHQKYLMSQLPQQELPAGMVA